MVVIYNASMYYEQLQALGARYGLQKRAGIVKAALDPRGKLVQGALKGFDAFRNAGSTNIDSILARVNKTNGRVKGGKPVEDLVKNTGKDDAMSVWQANLDMPRLQLPRLAAIDRAAQLAYNSGSLRRAGFAPSLGADADLRAILGSSNSPTFRKIVNKVTRNGGL